MIQKREIFRSCFDNFNYDRIAAYDEADINRIMNTEGMIRSRRKIEAVINNARCFQKIREEFGSFDDYLWAYSDGKTILYNKHEEGYIPVSNGLSDAVSGTNLSPKGLTRDFIDEYTEIYKKEPNPLLRLMLEEPDINPCDLEKINVPVLVTAGENDLILRQETERISDHLPKAEFAIVKGADHGSYE